jgi:ketosteroid isomerase-like protein
MVRNSARVLSVAVVATVLSLGPRLSLTAAAQAQSPSLPDTERSLLEALARHDRAAFTALLAPDASFFLPAPAHGPEAIAASWLPFLINGTNTMTLSPGDHVIAASGDLAYVTGTFAVTGMENAPAKPAAGEYFAVWRLIEGRWKLGALGGGATPSARSPGGVGGYRFGMTPDDVRRVGDCQPYTNVSQTGGLECANYVFEGRRMNISFVFGSGRLRRIQLWFYEGASESGAKDAIARAIDYLKRVGGTVSVGGQPGIEITPDRIMTMLSGAHPEPGRAMQFDLSTPATSQPEAWFARVGKVQMTPQESGYLVFVFADPRAGQ